MIAYSSGWRSTPFRRLDDKPGAAAGEVAILIPGNDVDAIVLPGLERRSARQIDSQLGFFRPGIGGPACIGEQFFAVDEDLYLTDAAAAIDKIDGQFQVRARLAQRGRGKKSDVAKSLDLAQRVLVEAHAFGEQAGVVVTFLELRKGDRLVADDPVEALDVAAA